MADIPSADQLRASLGQVKRDLSEKEQDFAASFGDPAPAVEPLPTLEGWPGEGIHFGMSAEKYHSVPALSNSGIKLLLSCPEDFWAETKWLNPEAEIEESEFMELGEAFHTRICEGKEVFYQRYAEALDPEDHPNALRSAEEIRAAIDKINEGLPKAEQIKKSGTKGEMVSRLLVHQPDAIVWETLLAEHAETHEGKTLLPFETIKRIEIAAAMIEKHPQLRHAFTGGFPEVSLFWIDPEFGVPCKARLDYVKVQAIVDLKTFSNQRKKPIDKAIAYTMAERKYHIQCAFYFEAIEAVKALIKRRGFSVIHGEVPHDWVKQWVAAPQTKFMFVFQKTGKVPVTRGKIFERRLMTFEVGRVSANEAKRRFADFMKAHGKDMWIDVTDIDAFDDSEFPAFIAD